jgi:Arc/MetJ family transcription regulator
MRTNIDIDDELMDKALKAGPYKTKKEAVTEGLKLLVERNNQRRIRKYRGKLNWEGDLDQMRTNL